MKTLNGTMHSSGRLSFRNLAGMYLFNNKLHMCSDYDIVIPTMWLDRNNQRNVDRFKQTIISKFRLIPLYHQLIFALRPDYDHNKYCCYVCAALSPCAEHQFRKLQFIF